MKRYRKARIAIISLCLLLIIAAAALMPGFSAAEFMIALNIFLTALIKAS